MTVYLDHAATTPMRPVAFEAMRPFLTEHFANPTGTHVMSRISRNAVDDAREAIADRFHADDVIFTSGGTEANNLAIASSNGRVLCSSVEHHAVLEPTRAADGEVVPVDGNGVVDLDALAEVLDDSVGLVSVMLANNETGVIQPLHKVHRLVKRLAPNALVHTDAVQAAAWLDPSLTRFADLVTLSAHKLGGPAGVGALIVRDSARVVAQMLGGGQERERRSGSHNVAGIVGFGAAVASLDVDPEIERLRDRLITELLMIDGVGQTSPTADKLPNIAHVCFDGLESESLLFLFDDLGLCASAGASCSSGALQRSHVLTAMGVPARLGNGSIRFSLGYATTSDDIDFAVKVANVAVERLRA